MYYRVVKLSGKIYANVFRSLFEATKNISEFVDNGDIIMICDDLEGVADFLGVSINEIVVVD